MAEEAELEASNLPQGMPNSPTPEAPPAPKRGNPVWGWLWQSGKVSALEERLSHRSQASEVAFGRARASLAAADVLSEGGREGAPAEGPILAGLYLQAIQWGLVALQTKSEGATDESVGVSLSEIRGQIRGLGGEGLEHAEKIFGVWRGLSPAELWDRANAGDDLKAVARLAEAVVELTGRPARELEDVWFARLIRVGLPLVLLLAAGFGGGMALHRSTVLRETDFPWRTSSRFSAEKSCDSPHQECAETRFFFCTDEETNPWIEFDLGKGGRVSRVSVKNRTDCPGCDSRALPLAIEVSTDRKTWKEVARRTTAFDDWKATFPREKAHWVRLRAMNRTFLHLQQVRIAD